MSFILDNVLAAIGGTPLLRLDNIAKANGLHCNLLAKVEFMSPGGSVKDRIAKSMIEAAEKEGKLIPNKSIIIEPTSGNTGTFSQALLLLLLSLFCARHWARHDLCYQGTKMVSKPPPLLNTSDKGYSVIITLPNKMSLVRYLSICFSTFSYVIYQEKEAILRALGAHVVRTPTDAPWDSDESHIGTLKSCLLFLLYSSTLPGVARRLQREIPHAVILDQYQNVGIVIPSYTRSTLSNSSLFSRHSIRLLTNLPLVLKLSTLLL